MGKEYFACHVILSAAKNLCPSLFLYQNVDSSLRSE